MHSVAHRTAQALAAFNYSSAGRHLNDVCEQFFHTGPDHATFEKAYNFASTLVRSMPVKPIDILYDTLKDGQGHDTSRMMISLLLGQMLVAENSNKHANFHSTIFEMSDNLMYFGRRAIPGRWSHHVEERYQQRLGQPFSYEGRNFQNAVPFVLALARIIEPQVGRGFLPDGIPVVVPDPDGLYLGALGRANPNHFNFTDTVLLRAGEKNLAPASWRTALWMPTVDINIQTFVAKNNFFPAQAQAHKILLPFVQEPLSTTMCSGVDLYNAGDHRDRLSQGQNDALDAAYRQLSAIIAGPVWRSAVRVPAVIPGLRLPMP